MADPSSDQANQLAELIAVDPLAHYLGAYDKHSALAAQLAIVCIAKIQRLAGAFAIALENSAQKFNLTSDDAYTLFLLQRTGTHAGRPRELAKALTMTTGGMTKRLDRLEKAGLVRRMREPNDRRGVIIQLTAQGLKLAQKAHRERERTRPHGITKIFTESELSGLAEYLHRLEQLVTANVKTSDII